MKEELYIIMSSLLVILFFKIGGSPSEVAFITFCCVLLIWGMIESIKEFFGVCEK